MDTYLVIICALVYVNEAVRGANHKHGVGWNVVLPLFLEGIPNG